jgi:hypothetical protein
MPAYYAVMRQQGQWMYVCSGSDPETVLHQAQLIIEARDGGGYDEQPAYSAGAEQALDTLRVVPEAMARGLRMTYPQVLSEEP